MTSATERLRALLDERGVEYTIDHGYREFFWDFGESGRARASAIGTKGLVQMIVTGITPEQAIDATLVRGTCRNISPKLGNDEFTCEECLARVYGSGGRWFDVNWEYHKFNYCPNCGRKVVE